MDMNTIGAIAVLLICVSAYVIKKRRDNENDKDEK